MSPPAWLPDPIGRHQYRWWDGEKWTHHVADDGVAKSDPVTGLADLAAPVGAGGAATGRIQLLGRKADLGNGSTVTLASPGARLGAQLIDGAVLTIPLAVPGFLQADIYESEDEEIRWNDALVDIGGSALPTTVGEWALYLLALAFGFAYQVAFIATRGQTLGKMAVGIKVVRSDTGTRPGAGKSLGRWALPYLVLLIPGIGWLFTLLCYLSLTWSDDRRGWHDKAAGTLVVVE